jgi:hypothetical protein
MHSTRGQTQGRAIRVNEKEQISHDEKMAIIQSISCPKCRAYAWSFPRQVPKKDKYEGFHHPGCSVITGVK